MKILYFITKSNFGGAQRYVYDLSKMAKNKGYLPVVAAGGVTGKIGGQRGILVQKLEKEHVPFISIMSLARDVNFLNDVKSFREIWKIIESEKPDVVHFNSSKMGIGILAARLLKFIRPYPEQIIFTAHGWPFNEERSRWQKVLIKLISWVSVFLSDKTITVASFDYEKSSVFPFVKNKIFYIPNGIGRIRYLKREDARRDISSFIGEDVSNQFLIGTVAELTKNKGLQYLISAAEKLQKEFVKFVIIGDGEDRDDIEKEIISKKLNRKVVLTGRIDDAEIYTKAFDIFLLPSIKEGLPYALLEAGAAGTPIIATSVGGIPEIIEDMSSGILIRKKDPDEIVRAIEHIMGSPHQAENFGKALKSKVAKNFNLDKMARETFGLYRF
jgi:glycosyltransferase involved in cell wall biosynthesis